MSTQLKNQEGMITAILTQAVEDAKYTGLSKFDLEHKIESINWIMGGDPQFKYYCKLLNVEPSYIQNKIKSYGDTRITSQQKMILKPIVEKLLKSKKYQNNWFLLNVGETFTFKNSQKDIEKVFYKDKEIGNVMHVNLGGKMFWSADILGKAKRMGHVSKINAAKELLKSNKEDKRII